MPNWAEGTLKIRGTRADIISFLKGALRPLGEPGDEIKALLSGGNAPVPEVKIEEKEYSFEMKAAGGFHVAGTRRAFVEQEIDWWFDDKHTETLVIDNFKQAWGIESEPFRVLSEKYQVDIKIYVFEKGMEFNHEVEIHKGHIFRDQEITFDDYQWDCIMPNLGG